MENKTILKIREFNRFYLSTMDFYENKYLNSDYSMTESRVLYEIYENGKCNADDVVKKLHLDKGYLSRIIKRFENKLILQREKSQTDARFYHIQLTKKGKKVTEALIDEANQGIGNIIQSLSDEECSQLEKSMELIKKILTGGLNHENHNI